MRREPCADRHRWHTLVAGSPPPRLVRTWFELDEAAGLQVRDEGTVLLLGSFVNWELALRVTRHAHGEWGVWLDLPPGR